MATRELRQFMNPDGEVLSVALLSDGRRAISSALGVSVWDLQTGIPLSQLKGHTSIVTSVSPSPNGGYAISGGWDETIRLWDLNSYQEILKIKAHKFGVSNVMFSPDGRFALSGSDHLEHWAYRSSRPNLYTAAVNLPNFLPYSQDNFDQTMRLWDLSTGRQLKKWPIMICCRSLAWSPDGRFIACGEPNHVRIWETQTWKEIRRFSGAVKASGFTQTDIRSLVFSPDAQFLMTAGKDTKIHLWDVNTGNLVREFIGHDGGVNSVTYSRDGRYILSGSEDSTVILWNANTGMLLARYFGHNKRVNSVSFSPDMQYALSGSDDNTLRLWQLPDVNAHNYAEVPSTQFAQPQNPNTSYKTSAPLSTSSYPCPKCGQQLTYINQYQRWYCYSCQSYL